jgi:hypothetical protein
MNKHFFPTFFQLTFIFSMFTNTQLHPSQNNLQILLVFFFKPPSMSMNSTKLKGDLQPIDN